MAQRGIFVYRFDYEKLNSSGENTRWHANIAAYNQEEAMDYLINLFPTAKVTQISEEIALHAVSNELRETIAQTVKRKPGRPKGSTKK
jgi:hypothetical protein